MDKKLLEALNNLSLALSEISEALKKDDKAKKSATTEALQGGNFIKEIKEINIGVKALQRDTKAILKNQQTIIELSKKRGDTKNEFEKAGGDKKQESNIKKGVGTILLIAVAVIAIGMAFKLVGGINFLSVIGLSIAMFILAKTFEKISALKMSLKDAAIVSLTMVMMATAVTLSSWIMSFIIPLSLGQLFTAVLIGVGFSAMAPAIMKIANAFSKMGVVGMIKSIIAFPLILPAIALGITLSSWILSEITPIGLTQAFTAILIAAMFTVIAFGLNKMLNALGNVGILDSDFIIVLLPLILPAIAMAITASSWILQKITPIGLMQAFTAILIALMFTVISFGLKAILRALNGANPLTALLIPLILPLVAKAIAISSEILSTVKPMGMDKFLTSLAISVLFIVFAITLKIIGKNIKNIKMVDVIILPALFTTLSLAIALSSAILDKTTDIKGDRLWSILKMGIIMAILTIASLPAYLMIKKMKLGIDDIAKGGLLILGIAATIMLVSHILAAGDYGDYPTTKWITGVGLSILTFGAAIIGLGLLATSTAGLGVAVILSGIPLVLLVVGSIVAADKILSNGTYEKYPSLIWAFSVSKVMRTFGTLVGLLGIMPKSWVKDGISAVNMISQSIVSAAWVFSGASAAFTGGPSKEWAESIGVAIGAFSPVYKMLMNSGILKLFGVSGVSPKDFAIAIRTISGSIVDAAIYFNSPAAKVGFSNGPSKEWSDGVGKAIGAFSPVYRMLMNSGILKLFGVSGVSPSDFTTAIRTVSQGIVDAAGFFNTAGATFLGGPSKEWSDGVGKAIGAFSPVYKTLMDSSLINLLGGKGTTAEDFGNAIRIVSMGIFDAAEIFNGKDGKNASFGGVYPTKEWSTGVGGALAAFAPVFNALSGKGWFQSAKGVIGDMISGVKMISSAIVDVGQIFAQSKVSWDPNTVPSQEWGHNVFNVFKLFSRLHYVVSKSGISGSGSYKTVDSAKNLVKFAKELSKGSNAFKVKIDPDFMKNMSSNIHYYMALANKLNNGANLKNLIKGAVFGDPMSYVASSMTKLAIAYDKMANSLMRFNRAINSLDEKKINTFKGLNNNMIKRGIKYLEGSSNNINMPNQNLPNNNLFGSMVNTLSPMSVPGDKRKDASKKEPRGKHGTTNEQFDKMIDLLYKLIGNSRYLDKYLKEKLAGTEGDNFQ